MSFFLTTFNCIEVSWYDFQVEKTRSITYKSSSCFTSLRVGANCVLPFSFENLSTPNWNSPIHCWWRQHMPAKLCQDAVLQSVLTQGHLTQGELCSIPRMLVTTLHCIAYYHINNNDNNLCIFYRGNSGTDITIFITYTSSDIPYCDKYIETTACRCSAQQQHM